MKKEKTKKNIQKSIIKCWFDGACAPKNPGGYMGWGAIIQSNKKCKFFYDGLDSVPRNTNNIAEYLGFLQIMDYLEGEKEQLIQIYGDSKMVVEQMNGAWKIKSGAYTSYAILANKKLYELKKNNKVYISWIPREKNDDADQLSNEGIKKVAGDYISFKSGY